MLPLVSFPGAETQQGFFSQSQLSVQTRYNCTHQHYIVLHYVVLHYVVLHYIVLHYVVLHYIVLHYIVLHHVVLCYVVQQYTVLHYIVLYYFVLHYVVLPYIVLHYVVLHYVVLHYIVLHYVVQSRQDNTHQTASCIVHIRSWDWRQTHGSDSWCQETARWRQCHTSATGGTRQPECPGP